MGRTGRTGRLLPVLPVLFLPCNLIADRDFSTVQDFREYSPGPIHCHGGTEAGKRLLHPLAGAGLTTNPKPTVPNPENPIAASCQPDPAHQQIGPPGRGRDRGLQIAHQSVPGFSLQQSDLAPPALVRVPFQTSPRHQPAVRHRIHGSTMESFDVDGLQPTRHASPFRWNLSVGIPGDSPSECKNFHFSDQA
jgi:hypothetical protein